MMQRFLKVAPRGTLPAATLILLSACSAAGALEDGCRIVQPATALPAGLEESSGVVVSRDHAGVLWTHNDSGNETELLAVRANGQLVARVPVEGVRLRDWEDLALAPCGSESCLYLADTGDGNARRDEIGVYVVPEPDPADPGKVIPEYYPARYPGGPRDVEAIFVLPAGDIFLISKGREESVQLFRYPSPLQPGETVTLEVVRTLAEGAQPLEEQVTGASATPSGEWVAVRSYKRLRLWRTEALIGGAPGPQLSVDLTPLGEVQGEAVALLDNGAVVLTSEGGFPGATGTFALAQCDLEGAG